MNLREANNEVNRIENMEHDGEKHIAEDKLYLAFIKYIAEDYDYEMLGILAKEVLKVSKMQFTRYYG